MRLLKHSVVRWNITDDTNSRKHSRAGRRDESRLHPSLFSPALSSLLPPLAAVGFSPVNSRAPAETRYR